MVRSRIATMSLIAWGLTSTLAATAEPPGAPTSTPQTYTEFADSTHLSAADRDLFAPGHESAQPFTQVSPIGFARPQCTETAVPCDSVGGCTPSVPPCYCAEDPCFWHDDRPLLHFLRNRELGSGWKYSIGGELRHRYMDEHNRLRPQGTVARDRYNLWRFTPFLEVGNEWFTGRVQSIDAPIFGEDIPMLPIDENRWDLLQYYADIKFLERTTGEAHLRYGRQFLLYGDQHLVSPLAWANTYRTFQGGRMYWEGKDWNVDGFVVRPSNGAASAQVFRPYSFDQPDQSVVFSGIYATYKNAPNGIVDLFWLWNDESEPLMNRQDGSRHTIGLRYAGDRPVKQCGTVVRTWDWNLLGGWQFGDDAFISGGADQDVNAGFISTIGGITFDSIPWSPKLTALFWWGSGDTGAADGDINTVFTLYPLGHAYWGLIDNFNGANLLDYSVQASVKPAKRLTLAMQWHWFDKATANDFIYNIAGAPLGTNTVQNRNIGNELDLLATYQVNKNLQVQAGYFWFWYGPAVDEDPTLQRDDANQFYIMTTWKY